MLLSSFSVTLARQIAVIAVGDRAAALHVADVSRLHTPLVVRVDDDDLGRHRRLLDRLIGVSAPWPPIVTPAPPAPRPGVSVPEAIIEPIGQKPVGDEAIGKACHRLVTYEARTSHERASANADMESAMNATAVTTSPATVRVSLGDRKEAAEQDRQHDR